MHQGSTSSRRHGQLDDVITATGVVAGRKRKLSRHVTGERPTVVVAVMMVEDRVRALRALRAYRVLATPVSVQRALYDTSATDTHTHVKTSCDVFSLFTARFYVLKALVHGQVTIIFVVSVGLSVCLFVCAEFFSAVFDPISIKLGHMLYVWV